MSELQKKLVKRRIDAETRTLDDLNRMISLSETRMRELRGLLEEAEAEAAPEGIVPPICPKELGTILHTALRKGCDSKPTSLLWNLINDRRGGLIWGHYLHWIDVHWMSLVNQKSRRAVARAMKQLVESIAEEVEETVNNLDKRKIHTAIAMRIAFQMFDDNDWEGFVSYLWTPVAKAESDA